MIRSEYRFFIVLVIIVGVYLLTQYISIKAIKDNSGICMGVVTKVGIRKGPYIRYGYKVNNDDYSSFTGSGYKVKMHVGDSLKIEYDTTNPSNHVVVYPEF